MSDIDKNNTSVDKQGNLTVDFTNELLPMTSDSTITLKISNQEFVMKPVSTINYYKYNEMLSDAEFIPDKERDARNWLVSSCIIEPTTSAHDVGEMPIGLFYAVFNTLMNKSFLLRTD